MKGIIHFSIFLFLLTAQIVSADVPDGDFETWSSTSDLTYWTESGAGTLTQITTVQSGTYAVSLGAETITSQAVVCTPNSTVDWSVYIARNNGVSSRSGAILISFYDSEGNLLTTSTTSVTATSASYVQATGSAYSPEGAATCKMALQGKEGVTYLGIYMDNASISVSLSSDYLITLQAVDEASGAAISTFNATIYDGSSFSTVTTTGTINLVPPDYTTEQCALKVDASGYYTRWLYASAPFEGVVYLPSNSSDVNLVSFSIIDYTGLFPPTGTHIKITKSTSSGSVTIAESEISASGVSQHYLLTDELYNIELVTADYSRGAGVYIPTQSETVSLVIGSIGIIPAQNAYGGFNYSLNKTNESVTLNWNAPDGSLNEAFNYTIYDSNGTAVYTFSSDSESGAATYNFQYQDEQYKIVLSANTTGGILQHSEYVTGETKLIDLQVSEIWYTMIGLFFVIVVGLCFGYKHASAGAFITAIFAAGLTAIGFLNISALIIALVMTLGLLAIFRGRGA